MALNAKQKRFCEEYVVDLNATQASIRAGYSKKTGGIIGFEHLSKPKIQAYIAELQAQIAKDNKITIRSVIERIDYIADEAEEDATRLKALDMLMKFLGGYNADKVVDVAKGDIVFKRIKV